MIWAIMPLMFLASCSQKDKVSLSEAGLPLASDVNAYVSVDTANVVTFHTDAKGIVPLWYFSDEDFAAQNDYKRTFPMKGTYTIQVKAYNKNGISDGSVAKQFIVEKDLYALYLSGSGSKTWVWDKATAGHIGCGPSGTIGLSWWSCGPNEKAGTGMYDDELTFKNDNSYTFSPGKDGLIYVNAGSGYKTSYKTGSGDYDAPCDVINSTYSFEQVGSPVYLVFPANTIASYIPNPEALTTPKFKIINISRNLLEVAIDNGGIAWHYRFIPK